MSASREVLRQKLLNASWKGDVSSCVTSELENLDQLLKISPTSFDDVGAILTSLEFGAYWNEEHQKLSRLLTVFTRDVPVDVHQSQTVTDSLHLGGFDAAGYVAAHAEEDSGDETESAQQSIETFNQALGEVRQQIAGLRDVINSQNPDYSTMDGAVACATAYRMAAGPLLNQFKIISARAKESKAFEEQTSSNLLNQDWTDAEAITQQTMITKLINRLGYERDVLRKSRGSVGWTKSEEGRTEVGKWGLNHARTVERLGELMTYPSTWATVQQGKPSLQISAAAADSATVRLLTKLKALNTANAELQDAELLRLLTKYAETTSLFTTVAAEFTRGGSA
ncbi:hypothetical protein JCM24511_06052 [Saitozyma sp. JCM 24511]|nr:hypothetical protein JCM24511_06052 [Saitozyma sp. JCM 24511]